jgi:hypothetical protein
MKFIKTGKRKIRIMRAGGLFLVLLALFSLATVAWAHQNVTIGDYTVEYGWANEPAVAGQPNAVVINIAPVKASTGSPSEANIDVSGLKIEAVYGGQTKALELQPLGENTSGQFVAPITPTRPGKYTIHLSGTLGATSFNNDVVPEEVQPPDVVQFPVLAAAGSDPSSASTGIWLGIAGVVLGAAGTILGLVALLRKPARN